MRCRGSKRQQQEWQQQRSEAMRWQRQPREGEMRAEVGVVVAATGGISNHRRSPQTNNPLPASVSMKNKQTNKQTRNQLNINIGNMGLPMPVAKEGDNSVSYGRFATTGHWAESSKFVVAVSGWFCVSSPSYWSHARFYSCPQIGRQSFSCVCLKSILIN